MSNSKTNQQKTDPNGRRSVHIRFKLFVLVLLSVFSAHDLLAQQSTAIQPCQQTSASSQAARKPAQLSVEATGQTLVDESLAPDPAIEKLIEPYSAKVRELTNVIGKLQGELIRGGIGAGSLGNFVTDALRSQAARKLGHPVPVLITNAGGLRKSALAAGDIRASDIFELLPFENALIQLDLTGAQLLNLLNVVLTRRDAQSGARITYRLNEQNNPEMVSIKLVDSAGKEIEIDPKKTYQLVTIDYLLGLRSGPYSLLQEGRNVKPLDLTMRDAVLEYVKSETAAGRRISPNLDGRFVQQK
jgi:2',3'-cyclic-nucleotide 2'-phosphodiesterase (5'-nucleotidase family)